jgi:hypothetical protein
MNACHPHSKPASYLDEKYQASILGMPVYRRSVLAGAFAATALAARPAWGRVLAPPARPPYAPRPSDVCFSARFKRPDALDAAKAFGATRLDWCYSEEKAFFSQARAAGLKTIGGTLNTTLPDTLGGNTRRQGRILDINGNPLTAPWMRNWQGIFWGCVNSPTYRAIWLDNARASLAAGVDYFMVDDATMNTSAVGWGGCFCQYCRAAAAAEGMDIARDMKALQKLSVTRFHREMRASVDHIAGKHITFASNNYRGSAAWPYDMFDFGIAEIDPPNCTPAAVAGMLRMAEMAGRPQVLTVVSDDVALNRRMAAWCYANGGHLLVPWDVYLGPAGAAKGRERLYARPEDFAPIYNFARSIADLLDTATVTIDVPEGAWRIDSLGWQASARTSANGRRAALHLVSWQEERPTRLTLSPTGLLPGATRARLLAPGGLVRQLEFRGSQPVALDAPSSPWLVVELSV